MHCKACDVPLNDRETGREYANIPGEKLELCDECTKDCGVAYVERQSKDFNEED